MMSKWCRLLKNEKLSRKSFVFFFPFYYLKAARKKKQRISFSAPLFSSFHSLFLCQLFFFIPPHPVRSQCMCEQRNWDAPSFHFMTPTCWLKGGGNFPRGGFFFFQNCSNYYFLSCFHLWLIQLISFGWGIHSIHKKMVKKRQHLVLNHKARGGRGCGPPLTSQRADMPSTLCYLASYLPILI